MTYDELIKLLLTENDPIKIRLLLKQIADIIPLDRKI